MSTNTATRGEYVLRAHRQDNSWDRDTTVWVLSTLTADPDEKNYGFSYDDALAHATIRIQAGRLGDGTKPDIYSYSLQFAYVRDMDQAKQIVGHYTQQERKLASFSKRFGTYPGFAQWLVLTCEAIGISVIRIESNYAGETDWAPGDAAGRLHHLIGQDLRPREVA